MRQKKKEATRSSGQEFNAMMNSTDHAAWKKDYDARMSAKKYTSGKYNPKTGEREYAGPNTLKQKRVKRR